MQSRRRQARWLRAAFLWLAAGLAGDAAADAQWYEAFARARAFIAAGRYDEAARALPPLAGADSPVAVNQWLVSKALVADLTGDLAGAVFALETQLRLVPSADARAVRLRIWGLIQRLQPGAVDAQSNADPVVRGWLELARVLRAPRADPQAFVRRYVEWQQAFPNHPALAYAERHVTTLVPQYPAIAQALRAAPPPAAPASPGPRTQRPTAVPSTGLTAAEWQEEQARRQSGPARIALVLPQLGSYARVADAIRRGVAREARLLEQAYNRAVQIDWLPTPAAAAETAGVIEWAQRSGYAGIIGPLTRAEMPALTRVQLRVPTVALNFLDESIVQSPSFARLAPLAQMGLSPQDDAIAAAVDAATRGSSSALLIVARDDWSERMAAAFHREFAARGGTVVSQASIRADGIGAQGAIRSAVEVRNFNAVFVAARGHAAQSAIALLRYYWVYQPPIYASRTSFARSKHASHDLRGVTLCGPVEEAATGAELASHPGLAAEQLGQDAAMVLAYAATGQLQDGWRARGQTGPLWYRNSRVVRLSGCATLPGSFGRGGRR